LRQHARVLVVTEVRGAETAAMLRESHARWATFCTFHGDSPEAATRRMVALARTDSWWMRSPYSGARDADIYQDIVRSFPLVVLNDVVRAGSETRYIVRGIYRTRMAPDDQKPRFVPLFQFQGGEWQEAKHLPAFPQRVSPQRLRPTTLVAHEGLQKQRRGEREEARELLEQAVRQTRRPHPQWLAALRQLADGRAFELRGEAQTTLLKIEASRRGDNGALSLDDVRQGDPTLFAFLELAQVKNRRG
jgi:plasmid stability protein